MLFFLTIWIHIVMFGSLSVLFRDGSSSAYFSRKLFVFKGAYANSLDHLDCSLAVLAVFYNQIFISERKFPSPSMKGVVRSWACAIFLDHLDFR